MQHQRIGVVMGDGQMAAQCARLVAEEPSIALRMIIHHEGDRRSSAQIRKVSEQLSVPHLAVDNINDPAVVQLLNDIHPDIIFSVNNWDVIREEVRAIPRDGIINFHNGPLPEYRGVNAPSWAIINREEHHGVAWHFVDGDIDTGDIVATREFDLRPDETAISLTFRCIQTGVELLPPLLDDYVSGKLTSRPQVGEAHYYSAKDTPNDGYLDFNLSYEELSALVRGLSFRPFDNLFTWPKIRAGCRTLLVSEISRANGRAGENWTCGEVREVDDKGIVVCARDGLVRLSGLMEEDLGPLAAAELASRHDIVRGRVLKAGPPSAGGSG